MCVNPLLLILYSGEGGIRTLGTISYTQHFQCCTFGRSVTSPAMTLNHVALINSR